MKIVMSAGSHRRRHSGIVPARWLVVYDTSQGIAVNSDSALAISSLPDAEDVRAV